MSRLSTSEVLLINHKDVYEAYKDQGVNYVVAKLAYFGIKAVLQTQVSYGYTIKEQIKQKRKEKTPLILTANHVRFMDHIPLMAAWNHPRSNLLGKAPYFQTYLSKLVTEVAGGGIPVWREKELEHELELAIAYIHAHPDDSGLPTTDEVADGLGGTLLRSYVGLQNTEITRMERGYDVSKFGEGARNTGDWTVVGEIKPGVGALAIKAWGKGIDTGVVTAGMAYDTASPHDWFRPAIHFGGIITNQGQTRSELSEEIRENLQQAVDVAQAQIKTRH